MKLIIISVGVTMQLRLCPAAAQMLAAINNLDVGSTKKERWRNQKEAENAHFLFFHANKEQFQLLKTCRLKQPLWNIIYFQHTHTHWPASPLSMFCSILTHTHTHAATKRIGSFPWWQRVIFLALIFTSPSVILHSPLFSYRKQRQGRERESIFPASPVPAGR